MDKPAGSCNLDDGFSLTTIATVLLMIGLYGGFIMVDDFFGFESYNITVPPIAEFMLMIVIVFIFWIISSRIEIRRNRLK